MNLEIQSGNLEQQEAQKASFFEENVPSLRKFRGEHVILAEQFDRQSLAILFEEAEKMEWLIAQQKRADILSGFILAILFYEPSTRTRLSFETAMKRLGGDVITESSVQFSSQIKGETLEDTIRVVGGYADAIALRHPEAGSAKKAARVSAVPITNAGDGPGQHPTQALLDVYTIKKELGRIDDFTITMIGDLKFGRTVHSLVYLLSLFNTVRMHFVAPEKIKMPQEIIEYLKQREIPFTQNHQIDEKTYESDVVYVTRVQKERFDHAGMAQLLETSYSVPSDFPDKSKAIIMHPLPRVNEIPQEIDRFPQAAYFRQSNYGVPIRMALLKLILLGN